MLRTSGGLRTLYGGAASPGAGARSRSGLASKLVASVVVLMLLGAGMPAYALAAVPVGVRIEGPDATVFSGAAAVGKPYIEDSEDTHSVTPGMAISSLDEAARLGGFPYLVSDSAWGLSIESINGLAFDPNPPYPGWCYRVNGALPIIGGVFQGSDSYPLRPGDQVLWYYGVTSFGAPGPETSPTAVSLSSRAIAVNTTLTVTAKQLDIAGNASVLPEAIVHIASTVATADAQGIFRKKMTRLGVYGVRVEKPDHVRSAITRVKVAYPSAIRSFAVSPPVVNNGAFVRITGRLVSQGAGLARRRVKLQRKPVGVAAWRDFATVTTARGGIFFARTRPARALQYRAVWYGDATHLGTVSPARRVLVRR